MANLNEYPLDINKQICYNVVRCKQRIGMSPSGKARDFDSRIRQFKSGHPSQKKHTAIRLCAFSRLSITNAELRHCKAMASFRTADFEFELNFGENHSS